jgi:hypothetical protein
MTTDPTKPNPDESAAPRPSDDTPMRSSLVKLGRLGVVGTELGLGVAVLTLLGWWLDGKWNTTPWLTLTGAFIGIVGGLYKFWRLGRELTNRSRR